jgi:RimJ/RimL family protein N-acetyltransferase
LETPRLILRCLQDNDFEAFLSLFSDPVAMKYFPSTKDDAGVKEWMIRIEERFQEDGISFYTLARKSDREIVGYCGLVVQQDVDGVDEIEVGYGLIRKYWGNGYATEAAAACIRYGFAIKGFKRIISLIRPENIPSIKVALRNGLHFEKNVVRWDLLHGVYVIEKNSPAHLAL